MENTRKKRALQTELAFRPPAKLKSDGRTEAGSFCPVYYPQTGEDLKVLGRRLAPVLARTGWSVRMVEGEEGEFFLELLNKDGRCRRLSPGETVAWQALLPQLSTSENLFSETGSDNRKDG